jgi:hypothetical protein
MPLRQVAYLLDIYRSLEAIQSYVAGQTQGRVPKGLQDAGCGSKTILGGW